jgi:hypothetical protein
MATEEEETAAAPEGKKGKKAKKEKVKGQNSGMKPAIVVGVFCMVGFKLFGGGTTTTAATDASAVKPATAKETKDAEWVAETIAHCPAKSKWYDDWASLNKDKAFTTEQKSAQVELGSSTFTLSDDNYVKMTIAVGLTTAVPEEEIKKFADHHGSEAKNVARSVISSKSAADLKPPYQGVVMCEIAAKTMVEYSDEVYDVYVTEFVVQAAKESGPLTVSLSDEMYAPAHEEVSSSAKTVTTKSTTEDGKVTETPAAASDESHSTQSGGAADESHSG